MVSSLVLRGHIDFAIRIAAVWVSWLSPHRTSTLFYSIRSVSMRPRIVPETSGKAIMWFISSKFPDVDLKICSVYKVNISSPRIGSFNIMVPSEYLEIILYKSLWPVDILLKKFTSCRKPSLPVALGPPAPLSSGSIASKSLLPTSLPPARSSCPKSKLSVLLQNVRVYNTKLRDSFLISIGCVDYILVFTNSGLRTRRWCWNFDY